jgi:hypothetical protein
VSERSLQDVYDDLGGVYEVAEALDVSLLRVKRWIERRSFTHCPLPVRKLKNNCIYSIMEWRSWYGYWYASRRFGELGRTPTRRFTGYN